MSGESSTMTLAPLFDMPKFGNGVGLHRMIALCEGLFATEWAKRLDALKVTGSNGKGSVCAMTAAILHELGIPTGLYTSPHLLRFHERIVLAGQPISDADLDESVRWCGDRCEHYRRRHPDDVIGAFEAFTAVALHHFAKKQPRALVSEAGIGGRYDSTRIIPGKIVGLTSLDLEHTATLGSTLELIAYEKADLCPAGGLLVTGWIDDEVLRRLRAYAELREISVISAKERSVARATRFGDTHMTVDLEVDGFRLPDLALALQGHHQVSNAAVAILLVRRWLERHRPDISHGTLEAALRRGLSSVQWPGRFQRIHQGPDVFIDVGHSPDAIAWLLKTVTDRLANRRILLVTGVSYDKAVESIVTQLVKVAHAVISTRAHHKGAPVERIDRIVRSSTNGIPCFTEDTIESAMLRAIEYATRNDMTVVVAGGLFLSIEAMQAVQGKDPRDLAFF
jgi:dihydrofolate synthase/folylpolyglutamate synthase